MMYCVLCDWPVKEVEHIAIDEEGDPIVLCDDCYCKVKPFFEEVKRDGKCES